MNLIKEKSNDVWIQICYISAPENRKFKIVVSTPHISQNFVEKYIVTHFLTYMYQKTQATVSTNPIPMVKADKKVTKKRWIAAKIGHEDRQTCRKVGRHTHGCSDRQLD